MYSDRQVVQFLDELASGSPTPGGGSAAALSGATGAALVSMVCNLTIGREKYRDVEDQMRTVLARADQLRAELLSSIDADIAAYQALSAAMKMPRTTDDEKRKRTEAVQQSLVDATNAPMEIARLCREVMELCRPVAQMGNVNAVSDAGVGVLAAEAGLHSAGLNVQINLGSIKDEGFSEQARQTLNEYLDGSADLKEEVIRIVTEKL